MMHTIAGDHNRVHIGQHVTLTDTFMSPASGDIYIGDYCMFSHDVSLMCGKHDYTLKNSGRWAYPHDGCDIRIGTGVLFSSCIVVIGPVTIGDNAVIGAGSVVIRDIPANQVWAGNPARFIKDIIFKGGQ